MHVTKLFYTGNSCQGRVNNCCIPSNFRCIMWFVDHIRGVSFWKVMKFFFLSFAFTNGNVFWSQGFYNWENLQLIQYISRFHNFTISDVKSKKKKNNNTQTDWQDTTNCIKISDCVYYSVVEELQNQFNPPTIKWKIVISQKPKKPLKFCIKLCKTTFTL